MHRGGLDLKNTVPGGSKDFSTQRRQPGYEESGILGTRTFKRTEWSHMHAPNIGHFGVGDRYFGSTTNEYGPHPGWTRDGWNALWDDPVITGTEHAYNQQYHEGPHSFLEIAAFNNIGTYNNHGAAYVIPKDKPAPLTRIIPASSILSKR